jgi:hypothetical protein
MLLRSSQDVGAQQQAYTRAAEGRTRRPGMTVQSTAIMGGD